MHLCKDTACGHGLVLHAWGLGCEVGHVARPRDYERAELAELAEAFPAAWWGEVLALLARQGR